MTQQYQRIRATHIPGHGDDGYSQLLNSSKRISKGGCAAHFYGSVESLQQAIAGVLIRHRILKIAGKLPGGKWLLRRLNIGSGLQQEDVVRLLEWIQEALFSLCAYCWCQANSINHHLPREFVLYVDEQTRQWWPTYGASKDFQFWASLGMSDLNQVRVGVRKCERWFAAWSQSEEMVRYLEENPHLELGVKLHAGALNRLSSYLWCAIQREGELLEEQGYEITHQYWRGHMPLFTFPAGFRVLSIEDTDIFDPMSENIT
jgi:cob(I)alamin adenosyltransferase